MIHRYEVQYAVDHAAMAASDYRIAYVVVLADSEPEAAVLAAQMVGHHGIPTATRRTDASPALGTIHEHIS